jgi:hypothetical protein
MKYSPMPNLNILNEAIEYDPNTGILKWKVRPLSHFTATPKRSAEHICKNWNSRHAGNEIDNISTVGYIRVVIDKELYQAQRIAYYMFYGYLPDVKVDHINKNRLDNRISNLRLATDGQNVSNSDLRIDNKTGLRGVDKLKRNGKYRASIRVNSKTMYLGEYLCPAAASFAYQIAADKYHGDFNSAQSNFRESKLW